MCIPFSCKVLLRIYKFIKVSELEEEKLVLSGVQDFYNLIYMYGDNKTYRYMFILYLLDSFKDLHAQGTISTTSPGELQTLLFISLIRPIGCLAVQKTNIQKF